MVNENFCIPKVCDFHVHLRQDLETMVLTLGMLKNHTKKIMAMLNVKAPHIQTVDQLNEYAEMVEKACMYAGVSRDFEVYLCPKIYQGKCEQGNYIPTQPDFIEECAKWRYEGDYVQRVLAFKSYPNGGTTNADGAITDFRSGHYQEMMHVLKENNLVSSIHSEMMGKPALSAENIFFAEIAQGLVSFSDCPKTVFEHLSTADGVRFVENAPDHVAGTITPQHLSFIYHDVMDHLGQVIDPHKLCMPIAKMENDVIHLTQALSNRRFFYGSDTAPHPIETKTGSNPAKGVFAAYLMPYVFGSTLDSASSPFHFEDFLCHRGNEFYGLGYEVSNHELKISSIEDCPNPFATEIYADSAGCKCVRQGELAVGLPDMSNHVMPFVLENIYH